MGNSNTLAIRGRRESIQEIRRTALPQSICPQEGLIEPGCSWWYLRSIHTSTTCKQLSAALQTLGWDAQAIRPSGPRTWLVCSHSAPPASHLLLNDQYVAVVAVGIEGKNKSKQSIQDAPMVQANFAMCPDELDAPSEASVSTRFDEIKTNLEDHISGIVQTRLKQYDDQIAVLQSAIDQTRNEAQASTTELKGEIATVTQQQNAIQAQIVQGNTSVVQQMQQMFKQMQNSINTRLDTLENEAKRPRKENGGEL